MWRCFSQLDCCRTWHTAWMHDNKIYFVCYIYSRRVTFCLVYYLQACQRLIIGISKSSCVFSVNVADRSREESQTWVRFLLPFGSHQLFCSTLPSLAPQISRTLTSDPRLTWGGCDEMESLLSFEDYCWVCCFLQADKSLSLKFRG